MVSHDYEHTHIYTLFQQLNITQFQRERDNYSAAFRFYLLVFVCMHIIQFIVGDVLEIGFIRVNYVSMVLLRARVCECI